MPKTNTSKVTSRPKASKPKATNAKTSTATATKRKDEDSPKLPAVKRRKTAPPKTAPKTSQKTTSATAAASGEGRVVLDYMMHAAQDTKKRTIGQASRSRKEKMSVAEQVRLSREMTTIVGTGTRAPVIQSNEEGGAASKNGGGCNIDELLAEETAAMNAAKSSLLPHTVDTSDASDNDELIVPPAHIRRTVGTGKAAKSSPAAVVEPIVESIPKSLLPPTDTQLLQRVRDEEWDRYPERENADDVLSQPPAGSSVTRVTTSTELRPYDYKKAFVERRFRDTTFAADVRTERQIVEALVSDRAASEADVERERADLVAKGYGEAFVTFEDVSTLKAHTHHAPSAYPTSTHLRCRYDHHRFAGTPIMIPIEYHEKQNIWSVVPNIVFCSFSCMLAYLERVAQPELKRRNRQKMAKMMARDCFGITDPIRPAPELDQHVDYGGRLTTQQWRALCTTHCSFIEYPMSISVPATMVTEIVIKKRVDRERVGTVRTRAADQHSERAPDKPERSHPDAVEDNKRRLKEGKGRPVKHREIRDDSGRLTTLNKDYLDKVIGGKATERDQREPARGTMAAFTSTAAARKKAEPQKATAAPATSASASTAKRKMVVGGTGTGAAAAVAKRQKIAGGASMWGSILKKT